MGKVMGKGRRDFCKVCWKWFSNGNFYKHRPCLHVWCDHCRTTLWGTYHATRRHMSDSQTCAASARCIRCHASWETICRDTNMNHDKHVETCTGRASDTSQEKRACTYGCGRWLVGVQDAQKHTEHCEQKMRKGRGEENAPGMVSSLEAERERIRRALKGHWEDLPAEYELARAAVREELSGDNDFPLALPAERMVAIYRRFAESIKNARNTMKEAMTKKQKPHKDSQMALDHESFTGILASAQVGTPLTAGEYLERLAKDCNDHDGGFQPSDWVVCTQRQASILLLVHHPVRPILVLGGVGDPMPEEVCMRRLERQLDYEIHDLTRKNPGKTGADSTMDPSKMPIKTFLSVQESRDRPLNMLSLPPFREAIPPFLNLPDYDVIDSCIPEQDGSGKHPTDKVRDCAKFGLCALKGAMSVWHMDQHGFTTAAICECGCKLWMLLPGMPLDKCAEYAKQMRSNRDKYVAPDWPIVGVPMRAGDVLIQPEGTLHAPYSESWPVTMSGYMLWSQRGMVRSTEVMTLEVKENTSNEDPAEGLVDKLQCVAETWARALNEKKDGLWPNEDQLGIFRDEVEKLQEALREHVENLAAGGGHASLTWQVQKVNRELAAAKAEIKRLRRHEEESKRLRMEIEKQRAKLERHKKEETAEREKRAHKRKRME